MNCPLCNDTGDQRYWEGRWRDERALNAELVAALYRAAWALERIGTHIASLAEIDPDDKWIESGQLVKNEAEFARAALAKAKDFGSTNQALTS